MAEQITINKSNLQQDVQDGLRHTDIAQKYGISVFATKALLKQAGLRLKRTSTKKAIVLIDDTTNNTEEEQVQVTQSEPVAEVGQW